MNKITSSELNWSKIHHSTLFLLHLFGLIRIGLLYLIECDIRYAISNILFSFFTHFEEFKSSHVLMNLIIAIKTKLNKRHNRWNKNTCFIVLLPASFISSLQCNTPWKIYCPQKKVSNVVLQIILRHTTLIILVCVYVREYV